MTALVTKPRLTPLPLGLLHYPGARCPACGKANFNIGRITAECANCDTALILSTPSQEH